MILNVMLLFQKINCKVIVQSKVIINLVLYNLIKYYFYKHIKHKKMLHISGNNILGIAHIPSGLHHIISRGFLNFQ